MKKALPKQSRTSFLPASSEELFSSRGFLFGLLRLQLSQTGQAVLGELVASAMAPYEPLLP